MAKYVINNPRCPDTARDAETAAGSSTRGQGRQVHFLDVWGDIPPTGKAASLAIATTVATCADDALPTGAAVSRCSTLRSALINWGLVRG